MGDSKKRCKECDKPIDEGEFCVKCKPIRFEKPMRDWDIEQRLKGDQHTITKDIIKSATYKISKY